MIEVCRGNMSIFVDGNRGQNGSDSTLDRFLSLSPGTLRSDARTIRSTWIVEIALQRTISQLTESTVELVKLKSWAGMGTLYPSEGWAKCSHLTHHQSPRSWTSMELSVNARSALGVHLLSRPWVTQMGPIGISPSGDPCWLHRLFYIMEPQRLERLEPSIAHGHAQRRLSTSMTLLRVDAALSDLHGVDENESEAVALCLVELLFAETNAFYRQHCLAKQTVVSTAALLTSSVFDAVVSSQLRHETELQVHRFVPEQSPVAEINDRHAARCIPNRSPEKPESSAPISPAQRTRAESRVTDRARASLAYKQRSRDKKDSTMARVSTVAIPQAIVLPEVPEEEDPEDKAWRLKCLRELTGEPPGPKRLSATSKWTTFTRQLPVVEPSVSLEVEIIDSASSLLRQEVTGAASANAVRMKSSLNTFSSVSTTQLRASSAASSIASRKQSTSLPPGSRRTSLAGSLSVPALGTAPRKATPVQLNDNLSRKRSVLAHSPTSTVETDPWQFELQEWTPRETMRTHFVPDMMVASAAAIPTTISLAAGVEYTHGESTVKGPERRENDQTMSRKRFELHQRLATDHLLQESALLQPPASPSSHSSSGSKSPQSSHHRHPSPRPYETVPPDPVPVPSLSPISKGALVIPRNHLAQSASTPSLRVRQSSARKRGEPGPPGAITHPLVSNEELEAIRKARPSTALSAVVVTTPRQRGDPKESGSTLRPRTSSSSSSSSTSKRDASSKYLREFPKPHAGSIKLNAQKGALLDPATADSDSARQRLAWIS